MSTLVLELCTYTWSIGMARSIPQRIQQHEIWTVLNDLDQIFTDAEQLLEGEDLEVASSHVSLLALAKHTHGVLKSINPVLVPELNLMLPTARSMPSITPSPQP